MDQKTLLEMTAEIVAAHASNTEMVQEVLLSEISNVYAMLCSLSGGEHTPANLADLSPSSAKPAVPMEAAFGADKVFCMVCGRSMKSLKRHLGAAHGLKPGQYRKLFGIPSKTPLVAKEYSERRKAAAEKNNLAEVLAEARGVRAKKAAAKASPPAKRAKNSKSSRKPAKG